MHWVPHGQGDCLVCWRLHCPFPAEAAPIYNVQEVLRGTASEGVGNGLQIWSTVSDAIVRSWLWLTATRTYPLDDISCIRELPSAYTRVRHTRAAAAAHPLEFEVSRCRTSEFARCLVPYQVRMWNPYTVFDTGTLDVFKGAVNRWLLPWVMFFFSFRDAHACGANHKQLCFSHLALCSWF